jgi:putative DNA primase/helicase
VVLTSEIEEGSFLAESQVKQMTGGDAMMARHLYQAPFEFVPQFKLFVAGNHKPVVRGTDHGIWRRIHLIPFTVTIPLEERDPELARKLESELPGILNWALDGYQAWRTRKLSPPPCVLEAVEEYRSDMDILGQWVEERCETGDALEVGVTDAYFDYGLWAVANGYRPWAVGTFRRSMQERFGRRRIAAGNHYVGLRLRGGGPSPLRLGM